MVKRKSLIKKYNSLILLPLGTILLLLLCVTIFGLGLNKRLFDSTLQGYIFDSAKNPLTGVSVCIEDTCTNTNVSGFYEINNLEIGNKELVITSKKHLDINQSVKIKNGLNLVSIELTEAPLSNAKLILVDSLAIRPESIQISFHEIIDPSEMIRLDENTLQIDLMDYKTGVYELIIKSDYYVDQFVDITVESDVINTYEIQLDPAAEIKIAVSNWLNLEPIENVEIKTNNKDVYNTDKEGKLLIQELSIHTKELVLSKDDYLKRTFQLETISPGVNPEFRINLIPEGKITFIKQTTSGNQIFMSNFDGSGIKQLTLEGDNKMPWIDNDHEKVFYIGTNGSFVNNVFWVDFLGEENMRISSLDSNKGEEVDIVHYEKDLRIFIEANDGKKSIVKTKLDDSKKSTLFNLDNKKVTNVLISPDGNLLAFSIISENGSLQSENGVYIINLRFDRTSKVIDHNNSEITIPQSIDYKGSNMTLTQGNNLFNFNLSQKELVRLTNDDFDKTRFEFQPNSMNISYLRKDGDRGELVLVDKTTKEITVLTSSDFNVTDYKWLNEEIYYYISNGELWISNLKNINEPKKVSEATML